MNIFVANLPRDVAEDEVKKIFAVFGNVVSVSIVKRRKKGVIEPRGFGFVLMSEEQQALNAIAALDKKEFMGRILHLSPARPKKVAIPLKSKLKPKKQLKFAIKGYSVSPEEKKNTWYAAVFSKNPDSGNKQILSSRPGKFRGGRRTKSYLKRHGASAMQDEAKPRPRYQDNPMRWRKKKNQQKPRGKSG